MTIMLGNLSVEQIEKRAGISISAEDRAELNRMRQDKAVDIVPGKWHCFGSPFLIACGDKSTAEKVAKILTAYDWSKAKQSLNIAY